MCNDGKDPNPDEYVEEVVSGSDLELETEHETIEKTKFIADYSPSLLVTQWLLLIVTICMLVFQLG